MIQSDISMTIFKLDSKDKIIVTNNINEHLDFLQQNYQVDWEQVHKDYNVSAHKNFQSICKANTSDLDKVLATLNLTYYGLKDQYKGVVN